MNDSKQPMPEEMKRMLAEAEIKARREGALELEKERMKRLQQLFTTIATGANVLAAHDLNCVAMRGEGAPKEAMELVEKVASPFKEHLEQIRVAANRFLEVQ